MFCIDHFINAARAIILNVSAPSTEEASTTLLDFCKAELSRELRCYYNGSAIASCIEKLSSHDCDGEELFACLIAARFYEKLGPHADVLLDELRDHDEELVFETNNQTYRCKASYRSNSEPLRFANLEGYKDCLCYHKIPVPRGQRFGM